MSLRVFFVLCFCSTTTLVSQPCTGLEALYQTTYRFRPSHLTTVQSSQKSDQLERFWVEVKSEGRSGVLCLQSLLAAHPDDPYFQYDGATLLYSIDRGPVALDAIAQALRRTDVAEFSPSQFLEFCVQLSGMFIDIGQMAEQFAGDPTIEARLVQEGSPLNRLTGSLLLYGSMVPAVADNNLSRALRSNEQAARGTAMQVMVFLRTEECLRRLDSLYRIYALPDSIVSIASSMNGFKVLASSASGPESRDALLELLHSAPRYGGTFTGFATDQGRIASAVNLLVPDDLPHVREARRRSTTNANERSLNEFYALTNLINGIIARNNLFARYRSF